MAFFRRLFEQACTTYLLYSQRFGHSINRFFSRIISGRHDRLVCQTQCFSQCTNQASLLEFSDQYVHLFCYTREVSAIEVTDLLQKSFQTNMPILFSEIVSIGLLQESLRINILIVFVKIINFRPFN